MVVQVHNRMPGLLIAAPVACSRKTPEKPAHRLPNFRGLSRFLATRTASPERAERSTSTAQGRILYVVAVGFQDYNREVEE